jgi:2-polyprenyl-6-methoxyphenol hydroxylase-like FAD-dependent oxidoreductase
MAEVVIVGAGIAGLAAALALGRRGQRVVVCERDPAPAPAEPEAMWADWPRPGTPHARLGHNVGPGLRAALQERAPDILARLAAAGAPPYDTATDLPSDARRPEDAVFQGLLARRAVLEGVLRRAVEAEPTVVVRAGCAATGLLAAPATPGGVPRVVGVRTDAGDLPAGAVIAAGGRRLPIGRWLAAIGAPIREESAGCGLLWYARHFRLRLRDGEDHTAVVALRKSADLGYLKYNFIPADGGAFVVELGAPVGDRALLGLHREAAFMAVARALPEGATWLDPARAAPIGPVAAMGEERNLLRQFIIDGRPVALGLHVIGDARGRTNSDYAWGLRQAVDHAFAVADALAAHPGDPEAQALALEARVGGQLAGLYRLALARDQARFRANRGEPAWDPDDGGEGFIHTVVAQAAKVDAEIYRALRRRQSQLDPVGALGTDAALLARARALAGQAPPGPPRPPGAPPDPPAPTREQVHALIAMASAGGTA